MIEEQSAYVDRDTGIRIISAKSELTAKQFRANVSKGYALNKQLGQRLAGFGTASTGGFVVGAGVSTLYHAWQGEEIGWTSVAESGGIGLLSSAATVIVAQQIEHRLGKQLAQNVIAKNLFPGLARGTLSSGAASTGVGAAVVLGFVAKDYLANQITTNEAVIQSAIGLGAVGASVGVGVIVSAATAGTLAGTPIPLVGNAAGFVAGLVVGTGAYLGGNWYYENFQLECDRAELAAFKRGETTWNAQKRENELRELRESAATLRAEAAAVFVDVDRHPAASAKIPLISR